jgi:hypothetical protein
MKTYKEKIIKAIDDVNCDVCGKSATTMNMGPSWAELSACWGYGSIHDGYQYEIDICENCFSDVMNFIKEQRRKVLGPFTYPHNEDPLDGQTYI